MKGLDKLLIKYKIEVIPILAVTGEIDWWSASVRKVDRSGRNFHGKGEKGKTPSEAITKLVKRLRKGKK